MPTLNTCYLSRNVLRRVFFLPNSRNVLIRQTADSFFMGFPWFCLHHLPFLLFTDFLSVLINTNNLYLTSHVPSFVISVLTSNFSLDPSIRMPVRHPPPGGGGLPMRRKCYMLKIELTPFLQTSSVCIKYQFHPVPQA